MKDDFYKKIDKITQKWFLTEPLLFSTFCTHELVENNSLHIPFRTGKMCIEYCSECIKRLNDSEIEEFLKIEIFRILLKHPYQRQPTGVYKPFLAVASDAVIHSTYSTDIKLPGVELIKEMIVRIVKMQQGFSVSQNYQVSGKSFYKDNSSMLPLKIHVSKIKHYFEVQGAERIHTITDGFECYIDKVKYLFQLEDNEEWYSAMRYNSILARYENVYGTGIFGFWRTKVHISEKGVELPKELCFEEWYQKIFNAMEMMKQEGQENFSDNNEQGQIGEKKNQEKRREFSELNEVAENWEENEQSQEKINNLIDDAQRSEQWGSVGGEIRQLIQANKKIDMNYAEILRHFSSSIISSRRTLSRMKPNRRFGFDRLGSRYSLNSNLLIAVDVSSSVTKNDLEYVFSIINQFFRYGMERIDVIQFDTQVLGNALELNRAVEYIQINGRGGTDFQPAADFYCNHREYDGMIYFTDGFGPHPEFKGLQKVDVLWIFTTRTFYEKGRVWADKIPGNHSTFIPLPN